MDEQLKAKFQTLLEYQKKDIELRKLNALISGDSALAVMNKYKKLFLDAKAAISSSDAAAGTILEQYNAAVKRIEEVEALLAELEQLETDDEEELSARVRRIESVRGKIQNVEKRMHEVVEQAKGVCTQRAEAIKSGKLAQQKHNEAREQHLKLENSKAAELAKLKSELAEIKKRLDGNLFAEYETLVGENKFPPVVPAATGDRKDMFNCGGCGLGLPQKGNALIGSQGWCRCENCRRIIVKLS